MEGVEDLRRESIRRLEVADHMIYMTYELVKDPKLLISILENIFLSNTYAITAALNFERKYKNIPMFIDTFDDKMRVFEQYCMKKYNINPKHTQTIKKIKDIIHSHRKSPVEFIRNDNFVICSDTYAMHTISPDLIKEYIKISKEFIKNLLNLTTHERIPA
jgi:hypothetical protein